MKKPPRMTRTWLVGDEARPVIAILGVPQSVEVHVDAFPRGLRLARRGVPVRVGGRLSRLEPHELGRVGVVSLHPQPVVAGATATKDSRLSHGETDRTVVSEQLDTSWSNIYYLVININI